MLSYGPVMKVLPYLSRRVKENGSVLINLGKERKFLRTERALEQNEDWQAVVTVVITI